MRIRPSQFRRVWQLHSWLGVAFGVAVFVLSYSGSMSVFKDDLLRWVRSAPSETTAGSMEDPGHGVHSRPAVSVAEAYQAFSVVAPDVERYRRIELPAMAGTYTLRLQDGTRYRLQEGTSTRAVPESGHDRIDEFLVNYHTRLFLGHPGRWIVGLVGLFLVGSFVTGLWMHRRALAELFTQRWRRSARLASADLHRRSGVWGLPFHVAIALTGLWLGVTQVATPLIASIRAPAAGTPVEAVDGLERGASQLPALESWPLTPEMVEEALTNAELLVPGLEPVFVDLRGPEGDRPGRLEVRGNLPGELVRRHEAGVDYPIGTTDVTVRDPRDFPVLDRLNMAMAPIHFGDFGNAVLRWLYAALGLTLAALAVTGLFVWLDRTELAPARRRGAEAVGARTRVTMGLLGGCVVATLALPLLGLLAAWGAGPSFAGSLRLSDLGSSDGAPVLAVFLWTWVTGGVLAGLMPSIRRAVALSCSVGAGLLLVAVGLLTVRASVLGGGPAGLAALTDPVSIALLGTAIAHVTVAGSRIRI